MCRALASLPLAWWTVGSRIVNRLWPGFRDA
jgi:hypothetical protein